MGQIVTTAHGEVSGTPDRFVLHAGVATRSQSAGDAFQGLGALADGLLAVLDRLEVDESRRRTAQYGVEEYYDHGTGQAAGFEARMTVALELDSPAHVARVAEAVAELAGEGARIQGLSADFADPRPLFAEARAAAVRLAIEQPEQIAAAAGTRLGALVSLTEQTLPHMPVRYSAGMQAAGAPTPPPPAGRMSLGVSITGTWETAT